MSSGQNPLRLRRRRRTYQPLRDLIRLIEPFTLRLTGMPGEAGDLRAYDLLFGHSPDELRAWLGPQAPLIVPDSPVQAGWQGSHGPAIGDRRWPRSPVSGLPMAHVFTLRLPEEYQRRGPELPAITFFAGEVFEAEAEPVADAASPDPFLADLADVETHPQFSLLTDAIGGHFGLLWLSEEEITAGPHPPPPDLRRPGEWSFVGLEAHAWDGHVPTMAIWLQERDDPNAGVAPQDDPAPSSPYRSPYDENYDIQDWADGLLRNSHLGGTCFCIQEMPRLGPYYLEFDELPYCNFGTGNAQLDLETHAFQWACD